MNAQLKLILKLTSTSPTACVHQLQKFGVDGLSSLLKNPDQITSLPKVPRGEEGIGGSFVGAAGCPPNAMNIILRRVWIVIVDDKFNILHIFMGPRLSNLWKKKKWKLESVVDRRNGPLPSSLWQQQWHYSVIWVCWSLWFSELSFSSKVIQCHEYWKSIFVCCLISSQKYTGLHCIINSNAPKWFLFLKITTWSFHLAKHQIVFNNQWINQTALIS